MSKTKKITYYIKGMHCHSCELLIEDKISRIKGVKNVQASTAKNQVIIDYNNSNNISVDKLNQMFEDHGYIFKEKNSLSNNSLSKKDYFISFLISFAIILIFVFFQNIGFGSFININSNSSLFLFFLFGLVAGTSTCAALIGGIVLSMTKSWYELTKKSEAFLDKLKPNIFFNIGRLLSYGFFGGVLGLIGNQFNLSFKAGPTLVILVSILMIILALRMLELKFFNQIPIRIPKVIVKSILKYAQLKTIYAPFIIGGLTFFLPCGFTLTAQGLALISGSFTQGSLIMFSFALGTTPVLFLIGLTGIKASENKEVFNYFLKTAAFLIIFFSIYNINSQLNILGLTNFTDLINKPFNKVDNDGLPSIINGKQVIKMEAYGFDYNPRYFKVKAGIPVRWEIVDKGTSGCTNAVISRDLFVDRIPLTPGQITVKEFTPTRPGVYKFSCWMGMVDGLIEVVP